MLFLYLWPQRFFTTQTLSPVPTDRCETDEIRTLLGGDLGNRCLQLSLVGCSRSPKTWLLVRALAGSWCHLAPILGGAPALRDTRSFTAALSGVLTKLYGLRVRTPAERVREAMAQQTSCRVRGRLRDLGQLVARTSPT